MLKRLLYLLLGAGTAAVGILAYHYVRWDTPVRRVTGLAGASVSIEADSAFLELMALHTGLDVRGGHAVEVLADGHETFPRLLSDLEAADRSIAMHLYFCRPGRLAETLRGILEDRARAGVRVRFLYDGFGCDDLGDAWFDALRAAGADVRELRPVRWYRLDRAQHRSHVRMVVVDGRIGYTGGFGIDDRWLGDGRTPGEWRDTNVRFEGPAVRQLQAAFAVGWAEATGELLAGAPGSPSNDVPTVADGQRAGLLHTTPGPGSTEAERFLALSIAAARRTLYIANAYFVPDDDLSALLTAAVARGVDVRVLVPGERTDLPIVRLAGRARYEDLLRGGVRIYEYRPTMMHAKTLVADGRWATIGSMNFDNRSLALNNESNLAVLDTATGALMDSLYRADLERSREITPARFRERSRWQKLKEHAAALLTRLL